MIRPRFDSGAGAPPLNDHGLAIDRRASEASRSRGSTPGRERKVIEIAVLVNVT
jgi:hypothetical protein